MAFDIIGDVHGHADRLRSMLLELEYVDGAGQWIDTDRRAVFVGDLIDRGPGQLDTLRLVRSMVDAGVATVLLGNHEFNAIAYATFDPARGDYCRPHSDKNHGQHEEFLAEVPFGSLRHRSILDWFMSFPLWLDLGGVRVVHACWSEPHIEHLEQELGGSTVNERVVIDGTTKGTATYDAIETVLKGPEVHLGGAWYRDKDDNRREHARLRWWDDAADTLREAALIPPNTQLFAADGTELGELPDRPLGDDEVRPYAGDVPVLFGHYWWRREAAENVVSKATCVDYSVAKGGSLCAYRWDGKGDLDPANLVFV